MQVYQVAALESTGKVIRVATADTASQAVSKLKDALEHYSNAWATNDVGDDLSLAELAELAGEERQRLAPDDVE